MYGRRGEIIRASFGNCTALNNQELSFREGTPTRRELLLDIPWPYGESWSSGIPITFP